MTALEFLSMVSVRRRICILSSAFEDFDTLCQPGIKRKINAGKGQIRYGQWVERIQDDGSVVTVTTRIDQNRSAEHKAKYVVVAGSPKEVIRLLYMIVDCRNRI